MSALTAREGYRLWAAHYHDETAVSHLENQVVAEVGVSTQGVRLLDVGCGTARRLSDAQAALAIGLDVSADMLGAAQKTHALAAADVRALPVATGAFDVVWCRLMLGHIPELEAAYAELSRVCREGGAVIVTDIAPAAVAAGHRRTFRDALGVLRELEHHAHASERHQQAACAAGLAVRDQREGVVGPSIRRFYADADRLAAYDAQRGLPLIVAMRLRKIGITT